MCLQIWGETKSEPFMQLLHFSFALGATTAPLVAEPFILNLGNISEDLTSLTSDVPKVSTFQVSNVYWAFAIAAVFACMVSLFFLWLSCTKASKMTSNQQDTAKMEGKVFRCVKNVYIIQGI